jgi:hypothetical protein
MATKHESPSKRGVSDFGDSVLGCVTASGDPDVTFTMSRPKFVCRLFMANGYLFIHVADLIHKRSRDNGS